MFFKALIPFIFCSFFAHTLEPLCLYLSWLKDPTTTMTIQWHTGGKETTSVIQYQRVKEKEWKTAEGTFIHYPQSTMLIHTLELQGLEPGENYRFKIGQEPEIYLFRTMPTTNEKPIRFVIGGDAYFYYYLFQKMNVQIAKTDPDFIVVGGDIAYTHNHRAFFKGLHWEERRWQTFFSEWQKTMVGSDGRLIPILPVIGNHDLKKIEEESSNQTLPTFFQIFAMPQEKKAYRALDFGSYLSLILLDTGHYSSIGGKQTEWLEKTLQERQEIDFLMPVYHVAAYPSVYKYNDAVPKRIRNYWVSLFEQYGVDTVFENHNHAYKRTYRIKGGEVNESGVQYLGDGSWGVAPRKARKDLWYIAKDAAINCFWLVTMVDGLCTFESRDIKGKTIEKIQTSFKPNWLPIHAESASETNIYKVNDKTKVATLAKRETR